MNFPLHADSIANLFSAPAPGLDIEVVASTGSTNADLRARLDSLSRPLLLAAEEQSAGRGRAGRSWLAAPGDSLCFSLGWRFTGTMAKLAGLPLAVGVVMADTLAAAGWQIRLKWPNDLLKDGVKLGGILIETASVRRDADKAAQVWAVIGVGMNVCRNPELAAAVGNDIAALDNAELHSAPVDRNALLASIAAALAAALPQFDAHGLAPFAARWEALHAHAGLPVMILESGQIREQGIAHGIDASGCLLLDTPAGRIAVSAGDVSLRSAEFGVDSHVTD